MNLDRKVVTTLIAALAASLQKAAADCGDICASPSSGYRYNPDQMSTQGVKCSAITGLPKYLIQWGTPDCTVDFSASPGMPGCTCAYSVLPASGCCTTPVSQSDAVPTPTPPSGNLRPPAGPTPTPPSGTKIDSCWGKTKINSNGCHFSSISGNCVLTVTDCNAAFTFDSLSGNGQIRAPSTVTSVFGHSISGNGCVQTESASTPISAGSLSGNGKTAQGGSCGSATCIAGNNLLWSCTEHKSVHARDISIGDSVRVAGKGNGDDICSEVYYVFQHKEESHSAIRFDVGSEDGWFSSFAVSYNHIVYVGTSFEERRPVLSQNVKPGDKLVTSNGGSGVEVLKTDITNVDLVNVLTIDPYLEVQMGGNKKNVVISAYSYDETMYGMLFAPVKYIYLALGPTAVEYMKPLFDFIDASLMGSSSVRGMANNVMTMTALVHQCSAQYLN